MLVVAFNTQLRELYTRTDRVRDRSDSVQFQKQGRPDEVEGGAGP